MADSKVDDRPLEFSDVVEWLQAGETPPADWKVGAEHEKLVFRVADHAPVPYEGPAGILALMEGLKAYGWTGVFERETLIGLQRGQANVSLEPGGQFELSGAPLADMHQIAAETAGHLEEVRTVGARLGLGFLGLGFTPEWSRAQVPVMPKGRYRIMRAYMPKVGGKGLDMMFRTCTVQANLDFADEDDMRLKFRTSLALQPVVTALFANSPFVEGRPSGFLTARANVWTDTDPDRTGMLGFVFAEGFGYETYANYLLDVPMYFLKRDGAYVDVSGRSFRRFMTSGFDDRPGDRPSLKDFADHATTAFPEVRLKQYLEMRGADVGLQPMLDALPTLWTGLLYDRPALEAAWDLCCDWPLESHEQLRADVTRQGLRASIGSRLVQDVARDLVEIAAEGLKRRARLDASGIDEGRYLSPLREIADSGLTCADRLLERFGGPWGGRVEPVWREAAF
ncbi:MAG: glutamate--cysteine ligase [Phenylobacterium sp.]